MATLELRSTLAAGAPQVSVLALAGDLNLASLSGLEAGLAELLAQGRMKVVLELSELRFISSSGLGAFLSTVSRFRQGGGDLVFVGLSPKIQKVFDLVGFSRVLTVLPTQREALEHLLAGAGAPAQPARLEAEPPAVAPHSGQPFTLTVRAVDAAGRPARADGGTARLKPAWGIVSPANIGPFQQGAWTGPVVLTGPGEVELRLQDQALEGSLTLRVRDDRPPAAFPVRLECPGCRQSLLAAASDVYRCRVCNGILLVDRWGQPISLRQGGEPATQPAQVHQLLVPSDINLLGRVRGFVCGLLADAGFAEGFVDDVELALEEALCNVVEHAYAYDPAQSIALRVIVGAEGVSLLIRDSGQAFDPAQLPAMDLERHREGRQAGGLGRYLMGTLMDAVEYRSSPEGNTLLMEKKLKGREPAPAA